MGGGRGTVPVCTGTRAIAAWGPLAATERREENSALFFCAKLALGTLFPPHTDRGEGGREGQEENRWVFLQAS